MSCQLATHRHQRLLPDGPWGRLIMSAPTNPRSARPSPPGLCSPCGFKPDWVPSSRDPRFSRRTPDRILARINAKINARIVGERHAWAGKLLHGIVRTQPLGSAKRGEALAALAKVAERLEAGAAVDVNGTCSPTFVSVEREQGHASQKTMKLQARVRAAVSEGL